MKISRWVGVVGTAVLVLAAVGIAAAWAPDRPVDDLVATLAPPPSQFLDVDGMKAHLRDEGPRGDPEPIVLLHGTSASLHTWDGWVSALAPTRRVIRVDLPGFGLTGPSPDGRYDIGRYVHFVTALMDRMAVRRAVLVGNSLGGYVAWKTAADHPDRVARLVLVDAAGYDYASQSVPIGFQLARMPLLRPVTTHLLTRNVVASSVRNVYGNPDRVTPALVERYYLTTLRAGNRDAVITRFAQLKSGEFEGQIKTITQPTLILWGGRDRLIPPDFGERFRRDIAGSRLVRFDALGHVPHEEAPAETVQAVQAFLAEAR